MSHSAATNQAFNLHPGGPWQDKQGEDLGDVREPCGARLHAHPRHGAGRHTAPVNNLSLKSQHYNAKLLKGVPDGQNPLGPVNRMRYFMQCFLRAHPGSNRDDMRGCGYESARGQA